MSQSRRFTFMQLAGYLALFLSTSAALPQAATPLTRCWKTLAPLPEGPRQEHGAAAIQSNVYVIGGLKNMTLTASMEKYDTVTDKWLKAPPMPQGRHHPNVAAVGDKIYVLGGMTDTTTPEVRWPAAPNTYMFDPVTDTWAELGPMPDARGSAAVGVYQKAIYLAGGLLASGKAVDTVSSYNTTTGKWQSLPDLKLPEVRDHGGGVVIGDTFYVVGGRTGSQTTVRNTTWALNLKDPSSKWQNIGTMPTGRGGIAVASVGAKIFAFGGEGNPQAGTRGVYSNAESFDIRNQTWTVDPPMKIPRHGTPGTTVGQWIYIAGGGIQQGGGSDVATVDAYGPGPC